MVAGDEDDGRGRESVAQSLELFEREDNGGVGRAHRVKEIAGENHNIWPRVNHPVNVSTESLGDVSFPLVDAARGLPVILPDSEMRIGDMSQFHGWRMDLKNVKIKQVAVG